MANTSIPSKQIQLELVTPERQILSQPVDAIVFPGTEGSFGVLPGHIPIVAALGPGMLKYKLADQETIYAISGGYVEISANHAVVLADTAELADEINIEAAQRKKELALAQLKRGVRGTEMDQVEVSLKKALARLKASEFSRKRKGTSA